MKFEEIFNSNIDITICLKILIIISIILLTLALSQNNNFLKRLYVFYIIFLLVVGFSIIVFHSEKALKYENKNNKFYFKHLFNRFTKK